MSRPVTTPAHRHPGLDVLRFVAIMLVLGRHMPPGWENRSAFLDIWQRGGWLGVDLFFVLSGFLVSGLLFAEYRSRGSISVGRFYIRRGLKIYPAFYFFTAVSAVLWFFVASQHPPWMTLFSEVFFLQSYLPAMWNHTWSLAVEEHFYLALPLLLLMLIRCSSNRSDPFRSLVPIITGIAILLMWFRWERVTSYRWDEFYSWSPTHLRIDSLLFGVLIGYAYHFHRSWLEGWAIRARWWLVVCGIILFTPAFMIELDGNRWMYTFGYTLFYIAGGALLLGTICLSWQTDRCTKWIAFLGANSYSIYLWHMTVSVWVIPRIEKFTGPIPYELTLMLYVIGCLGLGVVMARLVEYPVLHLRDRWFPSRSKAPVVNEIR